MDRFVKDVAAVVLTAAMVGGLAVPAAADSAVAARSAQAGVSLVAPVPPRPPEIRSLHRLFAAIELRDWNKAYALADEAGEPILRKIVSWVRFTTSGEHAAFGEVTAFIEANPEWPAPRTMQQVAEDSLTDSTPAEVVSAWFDKHPPVTAKGAMHYARALTAEGREAEAEKLVRATWVEQNFPVDVERPFYRSFGELLTMEDHVRRLDRLLWDGRGWEARRMLRLVENGHAALATARMRLRAYRGGVDRAISRVPDQLVSDPGLVYERLRWRRRKGRDDDAIELLKQLPPSPPRPELVWREQHILARRALDQGRISQAYRLAADHPKIDGAEFAEAEWLAGFIALRFLNEPGTALPHFTRLYEQVNYPVSLARGAYWTGRAAETMGQEHTALVWYRRAAEHITTFYGQLAAKRLDRKGVGGETAAVLPPEPEVTEAEAAAFARREIVKATELMALSRERGHFRTFVRRLVEFAKTPAEHALASRIAMAAGRPDVAVWAAKDSLKAGVTLPAAGWPRIRLGGDSNGLEHGILFALMRQESGFNPDAVSWAGARGLMQVMPATARRVSRRLGLEFSRERLLNDTDYNLTIGSAYFARVLDEFDGSYVLALAAYNAGPGRPHQWLRQHGDFRTGEVDVVDWIELIPFAETRNYVQRAIENVHVYRSLNRSGPMRIEPPGTLGHATRPHEAAAR